MYAADRRGNRIHVTTKDGEYLKEFTLATGTGAGGSTGGVAFSPDAEQQYLYISDLTNNRIWFLDRDDGELLGQMGRMSDAGGLFYGLHNIADDSGGNIYTAEVQQALGVSDVHKSLTAIEMDRGAVAVSSTHLTLPTTP